MYVANSEPAIWRWGRGRAVVTRRGLISGIRNRCEAGRDMGRWCVLPREALLAWGVERCERHHKTEPKRRTRSGEGPEGGRFTGSTEDSGPMKPSNSVEGKTLTIREVLGIT
jgi:hypothetical protein